MLYSGYRPLTKLSGAGRGRPGPRPLKGRPARRILQVVPVATPGPVGGIGHREPRLNAVRAQHKFEGHQHAPKEGPLSKDSRFRSEVERHRLNEKGTSEVAVDYRPRSRTMMEGHSPMRGNGAEHAPRISNTPSVGRDWAAGAFLGRPAAACARNRAPAANAEVASAAYGWSGPQRPPPRTPLRGRLRPGCMHERFAGRLR